MSESLDKLQNRILSDSRVKADEIIRDSQTKVDKILSDAADKARSESTEIIARAKLEGEAIRRSILSSKIRTNRLRILDEKNLIVQDVVKAVEDRLAGIARSTQFDEAAQLFVNEAVNAVDTDHPTVRLGFMNASKKNLDEVSKGAPKGAKIVFEEEPIDGLGGVIASDIDGKLIYNNSFKSRLERLDSQLLTLISSIIFGE